MYKGLEENKPPIVSSFRNFATVICQIRLNSYDVRYSQNVTCINSYEATIGLPHTTQVSDYSYSGKMTNDYSFTVCNNVKDI